MKGRLIRAQTTRSKRISCKGQAVCASTALCANSVCPRTAAMQAWRGTHMYIDMHIAMQIEVDAVGVITISRGCFERCGSNKKTPP